MALSSITIKVEFGGETEQTGAKITTVQGDIPTPTAGSSGLLAESAGSAPSPLNQGQGLGGGLAAGQGGDAPTPSTSVAALAELNLPAPSAEMVAALSGSKQGESSTPESSGESSKKAYGKKA